MKRIFLLLILLSINYLANSQAVKPPLTITQLADSIQKIMAKEHIPGLMLGITTKDSVLFSGGFGYADVEAKRSVDSKTLFRMGSNTKMFVSLGILKLVQEGKLSLNDEIKKIAPEVPFENRWEAAHPLRVVHLLEHTSGFDDMKINRMYSLDTKENKGIEMMLLQQPSMKCRWKPGERFAYSNPNYTILGYLIEKFTKKPYNQYLTELILQPLGMKNSNFNLRSKLSNQDVKEYVFRNNQLTKVPSVTCLSGSSGALWSCSDDLLKFLQLFLRNGQPIFSENIITTMETPQSSLGAKAALKSGYALGNADHYIFSKFSFRGHDGLTGTCFSTCLYNRDLGIAFTVASNGNNENTEIENLVVKYLEQNFPAKKIITQSLDKKAIEPFLGFYQFASPRNEIGAFKDKLLIANRLYIEEDTLYLKSLIGGNPVKLIQTAPLTFMREGANTATIVFTKNEEGKNVEMMGGTYFEQRSYFWGIFKRLAIVLMIILILISGIVAVFSLIKSLLGKTTWKSLPLQFLPIMAIGLMGVSIAKLLEVQIFSYLLYELGDMNARTLTIFFGTLFFGIAALVCVWAIIRSFSSPNNRFWTWYWRLTYASVVILCIILLNSGWIGIRTWAM